MLLEGKMGNTNRSVQKFTRWASVNQSAAISLPETEMEVLYLHTCALALQVRIWPGLPYLQRLQQQSFCISVTPLKWKKTQNLQMYVSHFRSKMCWNAVTSISAFMQGLKRRGDNTSPKLSEEARYCTWPPAAKSTMGSPAISSDFLPLRPMSKVQHLWNILADCVQCCPGSHAKSFHVLEQFKKKYSVSNVLWPYSQTRSGPRRRKKNPLLFTPNWFYDSIASHYSSSLNDIHDLILQRLPRFLLQSQNIIF